MSSSRSAFPDLAARQAIAQTLMDSKAPAEGVCDRFRVPDQAVLRFRVPAQAKKEFRGPVRELFEGGGCISSNFWLVPNEEVEAFLEVLDRASEKSLPEGLNPEATDGVLLGAWSHPSCPVSLVGWMGSGDWAADFEGSPVLQKYPLEGLTWLAFGGNDNGPHNLLDEVDEEALAGGVLDMLMSCVVEAEKEEVMEAWKDARPELFTAKRKAPHA